MYTFYIGYLIKRTERVLIDKLPESVKEHLGVKEKTGRLDIETEEEAWYNLKLRPDMDVPDCELADMKFKREHFATYGWQAAIRGTVPEPLFIESEVFTKNNFAMYYNVNKNTVRIVLRNPDLFSLGRGDKFELSFPLSTVEDISMLDVMLTRIQQLMTFDYSKGRVQTPGLENIID